MTDDLRTRIANAIWEELRTQNNVVNFDWLADAVIAKLRPKLSAWAQTCVDSGDMTPAAQRALHDILGGTAPDSGNGVVPRPAEIGNKANTLLDRIAAVLGTVEVVLDGWDYLHDTSRWLLADAVIRELQLTEDGGVIVGCIHD